MKFFYKVLIAGGILFLCYVLYKRFFIVYSIPDKNYAHYAVKVEEAARYCNQHGLNNKIFFLIDYSVHSGKKRMYLIDMQKKTIIERYMVSHGCGPFLWSMSFSKENVRVSNEMSSHCSSLGKYIIGSKGPSNWGIRVKYLLSGMEASNSNALRRTIVLHSWNKISEEEVYPDGTPEGWGCPAVSNQSMRAISAIIDGSDKKILLWVIK